MDFQPGEYLNVKVCRIRGVWAINYWCSGVAALWHYPIHLFLKLLLFLPGGSL